VMVVLTDGWNNEGRPPVIAAAARARAAGVLIYTVAFGDDVDHELMRDVAGDPSRAFEALTPADLERIYGEIAGLIACG